MKYFSSDWHLGESRIGIDGKPNLFYRPFNTIDEQNETIRDHFISCDPMTEFWHLGDVIFGYNSDSIRILRQMRDHNPKIKWNLIVGNYDEDKLELLADYFDEIYENHTIELNGQQLHLNHYPTGCLTEIHNNPQIDFAITGHIHGLWKVQPKMINVGVDAWHFRPVSEIEIDFCMNACKQYYDRNVFPYYDLKK